MDLVDPALGQNILKNKDYPLSLGYIGVVNSAKSSVFSGQLIRSEDAFFKSNNYPGSMTGSKTLKTRLMQVLEDHMSRSLHAVVDAVEMELNDARYFKLIQIPVQSRLQRSENIA